MGAGVRNKDKGNSKSGELIQEWVLIHMNISWLVCKDKGDWEREKGKGESEEIRERGDYKYLINFIYLFCKTF